MSELEVESAKEELAYQLYRFSHEGARNEDIVICLMDVLICARIKEALAKQEKEGE